ncbi:MAG: hypothetical protein IKW27_02230 [Bacteroidales bacterium]|nr:hypothetical protein [Bacteroidales bacterium]
MKKILSHIAALLLATTVVVSCSEGMYYDDAIVYPDSDIGRTILITGVISDNDTSTPLEGISVSVKVYPQNDPSAPSIASAIVYTDSNGIFTTETVGAYEPLLCVLDVKDENGIYESQTQQVMISWNSPSFDYESNTFIVNDCNFQLSRSSVTYRLTRATL